jgi:hypothetical protein
MGRETISVDDLLARQGKLRAGIRATIKADTDGRVTVTPSAAGGSCGCAFKITVGKADIANVSPTEEVSDCCGEKLMVVEVAFANETVASVFQQLGEAATRSAESLRARAMRRGRPNDSLPLPRDFEKLLECCHSCSLFAHSPWDEATCLDRCSQMHGHY